MEEGDLRAGIHAAGDAEGGSEYDEFFPIILFQGTSWDDQLTRSLGKLSHPAD